MLEERGELRMETLQVLPARFGLGWIVGPHGSRGGKVGKRSSMVEAVGTVKILEGAVSAAASGSL